MAADCPYGEPAQAEPLARYPCLGGCGCWTVTPTTCLACWYAANPVHPGQQRRLPIEHRLPAGHPRVRVPAEPTPPSPGSVQRVTGGNGQ